MKDFMKSQVGKYFAIRTYSHTNTRQLWKVLTRPVADFLSASVTADCERDRSPKDQEVFLVRVVDDTDEEIALNRRIQNAWHEGYQTAIQSVLEGRHCKGGLTPYVPLDKSKL